MTAQSVQTTVPRPARDGTARGVLSYGSYVPHFRLRRAAIAAVLGTDCGTGTRSVASYDEDTVSMAVEAGRVALVGAPGSVEGVLFASATMPYGDKTNATAIRSALGFDSAGFAGDIAGAVRSGFAALRAGMFGEAPALVTLSDVRTGLPGGNDESSGGDGAAAFVLGTGAAENVLAEYLGGASVSAEFLDRWRTPGELVSEVWEDRFGEHAYRELVSRAVGEALLRTGLTHAQVDRVAVTGLHSRAVAQARTSSGFPADRIVDDLTQRIGNTGTAHLGILLASMLDDASPGQVLAVVLLADGVDVALFRALPAIATYRRQPSLADQLEAGNDELSYASFLTWRGFLARQPARRPPPAIPSPPAALRHDSWKFALVGLRCTACGTRQLPPQRVCVCCGARDQTVSESLSRVRASVGTFAIDWLGSPPGTPPAVAAIIDFDGGGRLQCELTDVADPTAIRTGTRVEMTFRCLSSTEGVHNYFWKARPVKEID